MTIPEEKDKSADMERNLRRIFAFYDRFTAVLSRFFRRELAAETDLTLSVVEDGTGIFGTSPDRLLFRISFSDPGSSIGMVLPRSFLLGVIDTLLGSEFFTPDPTPHEWTELDENLVFPFAQRLAEILAGFSGIFPAREKPSLETVEKFRGQETWYRLEWSILCQGTIYPLEFILSEKSALGSIPEPEKTPPKENTELLRYIEMRRAASEKGRNTESASAPSGTVSARVLIGSFDLTCGDFDSMKPGDILTTDIPADAPFQLIIEGTEPIPVYPGENNGRKAVVVK